MEAWSASSESSPRAVEEGGVELVWGVRLRRWRERRLRELGRVEGGLKAEMRVILILEA